MTNDEKDEKATEEKSVKEKSESSEDKKEVSEGTEESVSKTDKGEKEEKESAEKAQESAEAEEAVEKTKEAINESKKSEQKAEDTKPETKKEIKVSGKLADIIKNIEELSVLELSELVKALEDRFGVTAAAPVTVAAGSTTATGEGSEAGIEEGQTSFNVILSDSGANKIGVIKAVRELVPSLGLKEAKDLVDAVPKQILEGVGKDAANEAKQKLEAAGAKVELQ